MTPTELELTNRWLKLYEEKDALYEEKIKLDKELTQLKIDYQSLKDSFEQKSSFSIQVLKDLGSRDQKENEMYRKMYEYQSRANESIRECGRLEVRLRFAEYRLEVARRTYAQLTGEYNPEWPKLSGWETVQVYKDNPEYALPIPAMEEEKPVDNDIYDLFKQTSNRI